MIRTVAVELTEHKALAYRHKILSGGAGITIIRGGKKGTATIDKRTQCCREYTKVPGITLEMYDEALKLTQGLPYKNMNPLNAKNVNRLYKAKDNNVANDKEIKEINSDEDNVSKELFEHLSGEYVKILNYYTDKKGKFSYSLLNKDLIKYASKSNRVKEMIKEMSPMEDIIKYLISIKIQQITNINANEDKYINTLIKLIEDIDSKSAFKETKNYLRKELFYNKTKYEFEDIEEDIEESL